jgi:hypothetical protein
MADTKVNQGLFGEGFFEGNWFIWIIVIVIVFLLFGGIN